MNSYTKFITALIIFTLLSFVVKAQRAVGNGTPITSGGGEVTRQELSDTSTAIRTDAVTRPELADSVALRITQAILDDSTAAIRGDFPAGSNITSALAGDTIPDLTVGNLAALYPGYTYNQLKTIRQANWESFQAACNWARANTGRVVLPATLIEIHVNNGEKVELGQYQTLVIKGAGKNVTRIQVYPHVKTYAVDVFDTDAKGSNIVFEDLAIITEKDKAEYYTCILRPGGVTNQIQITSANVYSWSAANMVGRTIYTATSTIQTPAQALTVTNYVPATKTITVSGTVTSSGDDDAGILMMYFHEEASVDTINTYGKYVRNASNSFNLIYQIEANQPDVTAQKITFNNVYIKGFHVIAFTSGDENTIEANNSYFNGRDGAFFMYSNFTTNAFIILNNCIFDENACLIEGYISGDYTASNFLGSAIYSHPNTQWRINGCIFKNGSGGATRQYSAGGGKPTPANAVTIISNTQWVNNQEYDILTSETMPSYYTNCSFGGTVYAHNIAQFNNCEFKGFISSYDDDGWLKFQNCTFTSGSRFSIDQRNNFLLFDGCTFTPNTSANTLDVKVDELILKNCKFLNNPIAHTSGVSIFAYEYPPRLIIENCDFQDTDMYLWWRFAPNITSYQRLNFDKVRIKGCKFAYLPFYASQVSLTGANNLEVIDCQFNSGIAGSYGYYGVSPREQISKTTLSGSTITVNANSNHYYTDGTINKIVAPTGVQGYYYFTSVDTTIYTAYATPGNTSSNLLFSHTAYPGETVKLYFDATNVKSASASTSSPTSIGTGNGSTKCFQLWNGIFSSETTPVKRGTMVLTTPSVTLTDQGNGVLTGSGGVAWVDYFKNTICACFDSAPTAGHNISVTYDYHTTVHQNGMWYKID